MSLFLNRFIMNLYERDRANRSEGVRRVRRDSVFDGARTVWEAFARAHDLAFDDGDLPTIRGLYHPSTTSDGDAGYRAGAIAPVTLTIEADVDTDGVPYMRFSLDAPRTGSLVIKPLEFHHRFVWGRFRTGDAALDASTFVFGDAAGCARLGAHEREFLLSIHYRRPWIKLKGAKLVAELDGIELDPEVLAHVLDTLARLAG